MQTKHHPIKLGPHKIKVHVYGWWLTHSCCKLSLNNCDIHKLDLLQCPLRVRKHSVYEVIYWPINLMMQAEAFSETSVGIYQNAKCCSLQITVFIFVTMRRSKTQHRRHSTTASHPFITTPREVRLSWPSSTLSCTRFHLWPTVKYRNEKIPIGRKFPINVLSDRKSFVYSSIRSGRG
jgi:hypothetical protein